MNLRSLSCFALATLFGAVGIPEATGYTPNSPVVQTMVSRGVKYLETVKPVTGAIGGHDVIVGYAHYKCQHDPTSPVVKKGIAEANQILKTIESGRGDHNHKRVYEMAVSVLLFADVDPQMYRPQLVALQKHLFDAQSAHGGWAYPGDQNGDVSQTQYALLAVWTLDRNGIPLDYNRVVNAMQWLMRVQDKAGGFPYHGVDPGPGSPLTTQKKVGMSMTLAGGSSLLIAGDSLRLWGETVDDTDPGIVGLPKAIKLWKEDKNTQQRKRANVSEAAIRRSLVGVEGWRKAHPYQKRPNMLDWYYYQMYTLERYESFIEISNGVVKNKEPAWYNQGVEELRKAQGPEGGWTERSHSPPPISTAFALLFLIRSTQKAVFGSDSGSLSGGQGLPSDTTNIRVEGTQIKGRPLAEDLTNMLSILEKDGADDLGEKSLPDNLKLDSDPTGRTAQLDRLERLVRGSQSWQARRVAARLLGTSDELRVVPALIFALSDRDPQVWQFARDGLRFISRKFDGMGLEAQTDKNTPSQGDVLEAQRKWRDWYRSMNPKYVFLDYDL